jgi:N-formylglutamate deformylase
MILHIPHSSELFPTWVSFDKDISQDLIRMTDHKTDRLFAYSAMEVILFPYTRLFCDVERFIENEEMEKYGHGICYTKDSFGNHLRTVSDQERDHIIENFYQPHHKKLNLACNRALSLFDKVVIVDCHSFSDEVLPHETDKTDRPDFCIGTDDFHTPPELVSSITQYIETAGYSVRINSPFAGTIVPLQHYKKTKNLKSIMIEVNRKLYTNSVTDFKTVKGVVDGILDIINTYEGLTTAQKVL